MHVMFVHQNFPAQFRFIAPRLVKDYGWTCSFVTEKKELSLEGVQKIVYKALGGATRSTHFCTRGFENAMAQAHGVFNAVRNRRDLKPDLIVAHSGFGSSLFLPFVHDVPIINFFEYFYRPTGGDFGYRPEVPVSEAALLRVKARNAMMLLDLDNCDRGWTPTHYQRSYFPNEYQPKISAIFDGIDTKVYYRKPNPERMIGKDQRVEPGPKIVTYVARGFEMMRGFDIFMKAAKRIYQQYPNVVFVVVGTDRVCYGGDAKLIKEGSFGKHVLAQDEYDMSKFRFTGFVPAETLADILSISDLHIYLTEPFIASWSMVDAMACGAVLLASDQVCVREYVTHGQNGLLCDFFDYEALARQAVEVLKDPDSYRHLGEAAARTVTEKYSLDVAMPRLKRFFEEVAAKPREQSILLEKLARKGAPGYDADDDDDEVMAVARVSPSAPAPAPSPALAAVPVTIGGMMVMPVGAPLMNLAAELTPGPDSVAATLDQGIAGLRDILSIVQTVQGSGVSVPWAPRFGPRHHPQDISRLLNRAHEWQPALVVDIGITEPGWAYLWTRILPTNARIVLAARTGTKWDEQYVRLLQSFARPGQRVVCVHGQPDGEALADAVERSCERRKADVAFMEARRPAEAVRLDFRRYRKLMRRDALFAWDAIQPVSMRENEDGGDRLWRSLKPMYPQHAEYLSGAADLCGGIAMIRL